MNATAQVDRRNGRGAKGFKVFTGVLGLLLSTGILSSCDRLSQVGQLTQSTPTAAVATVAQPFTTDGSGTLQTTVRAGADVVLTGTNSEKGAANTGVPIITYTWKQQSGDATQVDLVPRTVDTVSFTAPQVTAETKLHVQLTVADANGANASANAVVTVEPVRDADHFLQYLAVSNQFTVTAVTNVVVPSSTGTAVGETLPFTVTVQKMLSYTDINGVKHDGVAQPMAAVGAPQTYTGGWSSPLGSGGANCGDARNPQLQIPIPMLNLDDKLSDGSARLSDVLEISDIDRDPAVPTIPPAVVYARVTIQSSALPNGATAGICVNGTAASTPATLSSDSLQTPSSASTLSDNSASAHAYYQTIDPTGARSTLTSWLKVNGFNPNVTGWAADAHAVYTNNFDLGLGRDMYMKMGTCDNGTGALPLQQRMGHCDVATVVVNYAGVQAAANRLNPIVAVAMEYSAVASGGPRIVKFYTFAPDTRTGAFQRVTSVDLDHRGQRSLPQACVVCHGGTPGSVTTVGGVPTYSNGGNLGSGWLSWDLESFYYSDTDPGFSQKSQDAALKAQYSRANQEGQFKLLNSATYLTLDDPNRFALERELIEGWYGGVGLPNLAFDATTFVPAGWAPGGPNNNPSGSEKIYTDVFAHSCRACHILQVPQSNVDPRLATGSDAHGNTVSACSPGASSSVSGNHQVPMGCFWEFANNSNLSLRLTDGTMPFARRTEDRLWVAANGSPSPGAELQSYLAGLSTPISVSTPGTAVARIEAPSAEQALADTNPASPVDIGSALLLDGTTSAFPDSPSWSVNACDGTMLNPGTCARALPVAGENSSIGRFIIDDAVTYQLSLTLNGGKGLATSTQYFQVPVTPPILVPTPSLTMQLGTSQAISPYPTTWITGWGNGGAANNTVLLSVPAGVPLSIAPASCAIPPGCSGTAATAGIQVTSTANAGATSAVYTMTLTVKGQGSSAAESQSQPITVTVQNGLIAPALTAPATVFANTAAATPFNLPAILAASNSTFPNCTSVGISNVQPYSGAHASIGVYDVASGVFSYTPGPHFATYSHPTAGVPTVAEPVSQEIFAYTLQCTLHNTQVETASGSLTIPVMANNSFTDAMDVWTVNTKSSIHCEGCHKSSNPYQVGTAVAPDFGNKLLELKGGYLQAYPQPPSALAVPYVDAAFDGNSGLICWPTGTCMPPGSPVPAAHPIPVDSGTMTPVATWINDGANSF